MSTDYVVRIEPLGVDLCVRADETVMAAAQRAGFRWPTVCQGVGECLVCRLEVIAGPASDPPLTSLEREAFELGRLAGESGRVVRLGCQLRPVGDMTVFKAGVRRR